MNKLDPGPELEALLIEEKAIEFSGKRRPSTWLYNPRSIYGLRDLVSIMKR